jgi:hypothetical protein
MTVRDKICNYFQVYNQMKTRFIWYVVFSCRTVALWFYILVSDHNATDFLCTLGMYISIFHHCSTKFNLDMYLLVPYRCNRRGM